MDFIKILFRNINVAGTSMSPHKVQPLDLGPVLGHSTSSSVKVWGRSNNTDQQGILEIKNPDNNVSYFELFSFDQALDYAGIIEVNDVKWKLAMANGKRALLYRVGCIDKSLSLFGYELNLDWSGIEYIPTRLAPFGQDSSFGFVLGSCRHSDLEILDNSHDIRCSDVIENSKHDYNLGKPDFMLLLGDQVYADHPGGGVLSLLKQRKLQKESHYQSHYHKAWGRPNFSKIVSRYPSLMMWHDHDVLNNGSVDGKNDRSWITTAYENGKKYFSAYQSVLNPDTYNDSFYYHFDYGVGDFFVMDVRSDKLPDKCLLGDKQKDRFENWLLNDSNKIKFIVSPVSVATDTDSDHLFNGAKDCWEIFPDERKWLCELIDEYTERHPGRPVILLSGDTQGSYGALIINKPDDGYPSKLTAPFIGNEDELMQGHNFCHVSVSNEKVVSNWYSEHGQLLHSVAIDVC
ncbi:MAG: alkaline phosphatase D family protein [Gammaproteobacteria bacterium]